MPRATAALRQYRAAHLKQVMDNTGDWAKNWQDVLGYLEGLTEQEANLAGNEIPGMIEDIRLLDRDRVRFTRDYRKMWQKLTGENAEELAPPAHADPHDIDPFELQHDYFEDLVFPSRKKDVLHAARINGAPTRVMDRIEELEDRIYRDRNELLEGMRDADWDTIGTA